jgi:hypothetical protein
MINWTTVPQQIKEVTEALADEYPPTNTHLLLKTADYWLKQAGPSHPFFKRAIAWIAETENITTSVDQYFDFLEELKKQTREDQ